MTSTPISLILLAVTSGICLFVYNFFIKVYLRILQYRKQGIPTPFVPIIGNNLEYQKAAREKGDFCSEPKELVKSKPKPKLLGSVLFDKILIVAYDPKFIQEILKNPDNFFKTPQLITIQKLLLGDGLLLSEGDLWKKQRKYCTMAFHYDLIRRKLPEIYNISCEYFANIPLKKVNIIQEVQKITADVVGRLFFGTKFSEYQIDGLPISTFLEHLSAKTQELAIDPFSIIFGPKFVKLGLFKKHREILNEIQVFKKFSANLISEIMNSLRKTNLDSSKESGLSMIAIFYQIIQNNPNDSLTEEEITSLFISFFAAGMDTTGHLIGLATYFILTNPECKPRLLKEIETLFDSPANMTGENLNSMEYMTAVLKETLRMVPPTPFLFPREAKQDLEINGYKIFKGDLLNPFFVANNFDPDYHEDPEKFNPDRWLTNSLTKKSTSSDPFVYTPFSAGMRNCIGQHLAMFEAKIILSLFLKKFEYELTDKSYKIRYNFRFLYEPDEPLIYELTKKQ